MTIAKDKARLMYDALPANVKEDVLEALLWARDTLRDREGSGHCFVITGDRDTMLSCSFAKPQWSGDHSGSAMDTDAQAVCTSVCEYLCGC